MNRRPFLFSLGAGCAAAISGYFLVREENSISNFETSRLTERAALPTLRDDLDFGTDGDLVTIAPPGIDNPTVCALNRTGVEILNRLDGRHRIEDIAQVLADEHRIGRTDAGDARIALFIAELGSFGFLLEPFVTTIYETVES